MKPRILWREMTWWIWFAMALLLCAGLAGVHGGFLAALALSAAQFVFFIARHGSLTALPVQIRLGYVIVLLVCQASGRAELFWAPCVGTWVLVLFDYCVMARVLSLMPWNRVDPLDLHLIRRTFLTPTGPGHVVPGLPLVGCGGDGRDSRRPRPGCAGSLS